MAPPVYLCRSANGACNEKGDANSHDDGMKGVNRQATPPAEKKEKGGGMFLSCNVVDDEGLKDKIMELSLC